MLFGARCVGCRRWSGPVCPACGRALARALPGPVPVGLDACHALLRYEGTATRLLTGLKYANQRALLGWLADGMGALVEGHGAGPAVIDVVAWAPTTDAHRHRRGFDQAELLARAVARRLRRPCRPVLRRAPGPPQTGRSARQRREGPAFTARPVPGASVLVVDDVVTTGSTLTAAAMALRRAGAATVVGAVAARTPAPFAGLQSVDRTTARGSGR